MAAFFIYLFIYDHFFRSAEIWKFSVWAAAMALYSSYLMTFFQDIAY
jgi:hypothetical protein